MHQNISELDPLDKPSHLCNPTFSSSLRPYPPSTYPTNIYAYNKPIQPLTFEMIHVHRPQGDDLENERRDVLKNEKNT
jgi:hypothetical protein